MDKYNKINNNSIKGLILIKKKNKHIEMISKQLLDSNIIPLEYLKENIRLENISKNISNHPDINEDIILNKLVYLLNKECTKHTAKLISDMCKI